MNNKKFSVEMCSDLDFEGMVIDITYDNTAIASINYENGENNMEIKMLSGEKDLIFPLDDFLAALEKAKKMAKKCAQEDKFRDL